MVHLCNRLHPLSSVPSLMEQVLLTEGFLFYGALKLDINKIEVKMELEHFNLFDFSNKKK